MTGGLQRGQRFGATPLPGCGRAAIMAYLRASGDDNPVHHDLATARQAGFDDVLVPGLMIQGQMAGILARWLPGARIETLDAQFVLPVTAGSLLSMAGRVAALRADGAAILRLMAMKGAQVAVLGEATVSPGLVQTDHPARGSGFSNSR